MCVCAVCGSLQLGQEERNGVRDVLDVTFVQILENMSQTCTSPQDTLANINLYHMCNCSRVVV